MWERHGSTTVANDGTLRVIVYYGHEDPLQEVGRTNGIYFFILTPEEFVLLSYRSRKEIDLSVLFFKRCIYFHVLYMYSESTALPIPLVRHMLTVAGAGVRVGREQHQ